MIRTAFVCCFLCVFLVLPSCSSSGSGPLQAFNFNGQWQTDELMQVRREGDCESLLRTIPLTFPAFSYSIEQVGENITLRDETGVLTGVDRVDNFTVRDESASPGEVVSPDTLEPPFSDPAVECIVNTIISYVAESETNGTVTVTFDFECFNRETGEFLTECRVIYSGSSKRVSSELQM